LDLSNFRIEDLNLARGRDVYSCFSLCPVMAEALWWSDLPSKDSHGAVTPRETAKRLVEALRWSDLPSKDSYGAVMPRGTAERIVEAL
jgi:hypothetical protein